VKSTRSRDRHLDTSLALDYLERRLDEAARRLVEEHLGRPCSDCRERVRVLGELLETMREDRVGAVPGELRQRALERFAPAERPAPARGPVAAVAELLFDSARQPLTAAARRSVGEARRMRFRLGTHALELELEREGASTLSVRGRLAAPDAHLWSVAVEMGPERRVVHPDVTGSFVLDGLPLLPITMLLRGAGERFRLPAMEP